MSTATTAFGAETPHVFRQSNFLRWWTGAAISLFGDQFYLVALAWLVLQLTGSGIALGAILTAGALPRGILMLVGGAVSDRLSPRKVMIATASTQAILVAAIAVLIALHSLQLWHLYVISFWFGVADAFTFPASQAFLPFMVRSEQLAQANSAVQGAFQLSTVAAPVPAALVVQHFGPAWAFLLDSVSFLAIIAALWGLPDPPASPVGEKSSMATAIGDGLKYVWRDSAIRTLIVLMAALNFCLFGPIRVGLPYLAKFRFHTPTVFGVWLSAFAAGSLAGTIAGGLKYKYRRGRVLLFVGAAFGVGAILLVCSPDVWLAAVDLFCMGVMMGVANVQVMAWIQNRSERAMLGRVSGVQAFMAYGFAPVSLAIAGVLAQWNVKMLFFAAGILMLGVTGTAALCRAVREID